MVYSLRDRASAPALSDLPLWHKPFQRPAIEFGPAPLTPLAGRIPEGLRGTLYRNGPGRLERGGVPYGHWFDGDGAILAVRFDGGQARATYRYVQSRFYRQEEAENRAIFGNYGMVPPGPWLGRFNKSLKNAANTSVLPLGDRLLALWEGGHPHALDRDTLETLGEDDLGYLQASEAFSAHPKVDPRTGAIFNFGLEVGPRPALHLCRLDGAGRLQRRSRLPLKNLSLIHDCVWTGRHLVFCVPPVGMRLLPALLRLESFSEALTWQPDGVTQIWVVDGDTLEVTARLEAPPWFQWHFGNGWTEADGAIAFSLCRYDDLATNQHLREIPTGRVWRAAPAQFVEVRLDPAANRVRAQTVIYDRHCDFPVVAARAVGQRSRYSYLSVHRAEFPQPEDYRLELFGAIACHDAQRETVAIAEAGPGRYPSEPVVAMDCGGDGDANAPQNWLLSVVYDGNHDRSELWIYDAAAIAQGPHCRLALPGVVPHSFHGIWSPA
jgi:all-trans-8'-apo-beta-carotenal 15,15'-oxygenase